MEDAQSVVEFAGFPIANLFGRIEFFFLRTTKGRTPYFSTKKSVVRAVLQAQKLFKNFN